MPDSSKTIQKKHDDLFFNSFKLLTVVLIVIGILIRFINLDEKITWADETFTYLRIYGYTKSDLMQEVVNSQILTAGTLLQKYQSPGVGKSIIDTVKGLALEDPKHPPLYFVMTNLWVQCFGSTVAATRSFSAFISLLVFPALYWLCQELFQSKIVGLVAIAIIAVSPFHLVYAQEARMYSFSTLNILLSSAALLRAIRLHTKSSWSIYSITLLIGLYTNLLFSLVAIGQGIYVAVNQELRTRKILIAYLSALLAGILAFLPWLFLIITQTDKVQETIRWSKLIVPLNNLVDLWQINWARIFFDITSKSSYSDQLQNNVWFLIIRLLVILLFYAVYFLCRKTPKSTWSFILILILLTALAQAIPDLIFGGIRSIIIRYSIPVYLGCHLAVAYLLAQKAILSPYMNMRKHLWRLLLLGLISLQIISCLIILPKKTWWNKAYNSDNIPIVNIIKQSPNPLIICLKCGRDWGWGNVLSISYLLEPQTKFQLFPETNIKEIPDTFTDVFFLNASEKLQDTLKKEQGLNIGLVFKHNLSLWKLKK
ncbi:glycosyltransferase family 39 protein [Nostoc sp. FACHB-888]|uniref:glycosyltransferase family 39 protein n=1 Tax=Nostoc sp. FACHB-888 TaxID=2692842 RepID=UPI0016877A50|nr:glycosyltransferase family 39 protein [Nostoc sp. FACHB-888]MBD2244056.1 glycosyltransferase family 39 protein [Nostoc sp. FACHB-888]